MLAKVVWFNDAKGFGFATPQDGGKDVFVHYQNILGDGFKSLKPDQVIEYEIGTGRDGRDIAIKIQVVE